MRGKRKKLSCATVITGVVLLAVSAFSIYPFVYMFLLSLTQSTSMHLRLVDGVSLVNYTRVLKGFDFLLYFKNSAVASVLACALYCLLASMAAYGFAKKRFPGREAVFFLYLATMMIPGQVTIIPVFSIMRRLNILNTYAALVLPTFGAFGVFLIRQFLVSLPDDLLEAARIDGCGEIRTFVCVVLPLIKSVLISLTVFTFMNTWNDFIWPLVVCTETKMQTLTVALSVLKGNYTSNYGLIMAGATLTFLPPFILFVFLQKQFVEGIALSGIKV